MGKIFLMEELNIKKQEQVLYSETYEVKYWLKEDEFWKPKDIMYHAKRKDEHQYVQKRWENDFKNQEVKLIGIYYQ